MAHQKILVDPAIVYGNILQDRVLMTGQGFQNNDSFCFFIRCKKKASEPVMVSLEDRSLEVARNFTLLDDPFHDTTNLTRNDPFVDRT